MKAVVFTLGCKVNSCESDSLLYGLQQLGYEISDNLEYADLYIINTCAVTAEAEKKSRQCIARAKKFNPQAKIIVTGCASEKSPKDFLSKENVTLVTGAKSKGKILEMLFVSGENISCEDKEFEELFPVKNLKSRAYIKIQDGCNNFCAYCIIPYLRGRSRSRKIENIITEIDNCDAEEIVLTGINISSFNDNGWKFADLIDKIKTDKRIRLGSIEVKIIDENLLSALKRLNNFAPQFHLSLQSGSNSVLKAMNRKYSAEEFYQKCCLIRQYFENAAITTDIISGFPTETEENFAETLAFMDRVKFSHAHCFSYSKRTGTKAAELKELSENIKKERLNRLLEKAKALEEEYILKNIGTVQEVLFEESKEGLSIGYTGNYIRVYVDGNISGLKKVKLLERYLDGCKGICE